MDTRMLLELMFILHASLEIVLGTRKTRSISNKLLLSDFTSPFPTNSWGMILMASQKEMGASFSANTSHHPTPAIGLLVPWEKTHRGCTLAHKCLVCLVHSPQTTIVSPQTWVEKSITRLSVVLLQTAVRLWLKYEYISDYHSNIEKFRKA